MAKTRKDFQTMHNAVADYSEATAAPRQYAVARNNLLNTDYLAELDVANALIRQGMNMLDDLRDKLFNDACNAST